MGTTDSPHDRITAANGACAGDLETRSQACDRAADDMADRLSGLADRLGTALRPQRMPFGKGRLAGALRRRSPAGFVLDAVNLQMLLTDGRLWSYSRSSSLGAPAGTFFDVRAHHSRFAASRGFFAGRQFTFLGLVMGTYTFGLVDRPGGDQGTWELCALCTEGQSITYVTVDDALSDIGDRVIRRGQVR